MDSTISETLEHILLLARHLKKCDKNGALIVMLMELRVPTKSMGFEFLKSAILLFYKDPTRALSKDIYQEITLHYRQGSESQVDQAIRDAIDKAWKTGDQTAWRWYFAYNGQHKTRKPSNAEVITRLARLLELWKRLRDREVCYETE